jgi:hypothetical protein
LFFLQLVVGLGSGIITGWAASLEQNNTQVLAMVGVVIVFFEVAKQVPRLASSLVTGGITGGGYRFGLGANSMNSISSAASTAAAPFSSTVRSGVGASSLTKALAVGGASAAMSAYRDSREEGSGIKRSAAHGVTSFAKAVVPNLASAGLEEFRAGGSFKRKNSLDRMSATVEQNNKASQRSKANTNINRITGGSNDSK